MKRALLCLLLVAVAEPAVARRAPTVGGSVTVAVDPDVAALAQSAGQRVPLLAPLPPDAPAWQRRLNPGLGGTDLRSTRISALEPSEGGRSWRVQGEGLAAPLEDCLTGSSWPARALHAAGVTASVAPRPDGALVRFDRAVGALPELLAGCTTAAASAFIPAGERLERTSGAGVSTLVFVDPTQRADVQRDAAAGPDRSLVVSDREGVLLLLQGEAARSTDPLGTGQGCGGLRAFRERLRPGLMAQVLADGRAEAARSLLPPSLAPPQPACDESASVGEPAADAVLSLAAGDDALQRGLADRLAALARAAATRLDPDAPPNARLLRWAPASRDPALALLALADAHDELPADGLQEPRLLDADPARRLEAALDLQDRWLRERRVVPLLVARAWLSVDRDLRGVRVRADGVPLLHDAWWRFP